MRKRLVRKTFDMIQDISESENKEVGGQQLSCLFFFRCTRKLLLTRKCLNLIPGLQEIMGELWQVHKVRLH